VYVHSSSEDSNVIGGSTGTLAVIRKILEAKGLSQDPEIRNMVDDCLTNLCVYWRSSNPNQLIGSHTDPSDMRDTINRDDAIMGDAEGEDMPISEKTVDTETVSSEQDVESSLPTLNSCETPTRGQNLSLGSARSCPHRSVFGSSEPTESFSEIASETDEPSILCAIPCHKGGIICVNGTPCTYRYGTKKKIPDANKRSEYM